MYFTTFCISIVGLTELMKAHNPVYREHEKMSSIRLRRVAFYPVLFWAYDFLSEWMV